MLQQQVRRVVRMAFVAVAALHALAAVADAQHPRAGVAPPAPMAAAGEQRGAESVVPGLPRSAELIVVIDDAAALRRSGLWGVLRPLLGDMPALDGTWEGLADDLGWEPDAAFDRLLGRRVVLVARGLPRDLGLLGEAPLGRTQWALLSDISIETDRRLLKTLEIVPRDIIRGHQLLAIEGGRYKLALNRTRPPGGGEVTSTAILGPSDAPELLEELIGAIAEGAPAPMAGTAACDAIGAMGRAGAAVLYREPAPAGQEWEDFVGLSVRHDGAGRWTAQLAVSDRAMRGHLLKLPVSTDAALRAISRGALAAVVESRLPDDAGGEMSGTLLRWLLDHLGMPAELQRQFATRQAVVAAAAGGDADAGLRVAVGIELSDLGQAAPLADGYLRAMCAAIDPEAGAVAEFAGCAPAAVRIVPLHRAPGALAALGRGSGVELAWAFAGGGKAGKGGDAAWWVLGAAPASVTDAGASQAGETVRGLGAALTGNAAGEKGRWLSHGFVRPAGLAGVIQAGRGGPWLAAAKSIDEITWALRISDEGQIRGTVTVQRSGDPAP